MKFLILIVALMLIGRALGQSNDFNATMSTAAYNTQEGLTSIWLSAAAYCGKDNYAKHVFKGPTTGFVYTSTIYDAATDTQGYIGYMVSTKSIYVVYRGSQDIRNWVANIDAVKTTYTTYPECNCQVHKGFYQAEQKVISSVISQVKSLMSSHAGYAVKVTGHSLGK